MQKFIEGFQWAIPEAFHDALSICSFNRGDVFYSHPWGYLSSENLARQSSQQFFSIQIIDAQSKSAPTELLPDEEEGKKRLHRFHKNWNASIEFVLRDKWSESESKLFSTTQGRLYTLLWKGDLSVLDSHETLKKPKLYEEAKKYLSYALPHFKDAFSKNFEVIPQSLFILTIDQLQRGVLLKVKKINGMLGSKNF